MAGVGIFCVSVPAQAANTNPAITFEAGFTNTNPVGSWRSLKFYAVTNYTNTATNRVLFNPVFSNITVITLTSTSAVTLSTPVITTNAGQLLTNVNVTNNLVFDLYQGLLQGVARGPMILDIPANRFVLNWTNSTNNFTNAPTNRTNVASGTTNSTNSYRIVYQAQPTNLLTTTNFLANTNTPLPVTNAFTGLTNLYTVLSGPASISASGGTNYLVAGPPGLVLIQVASPASSDGLWAAGTNVFRILLTNAPAAGFAFVTATNAPAFTKTNLVFDEITPLVLTNRGDSRVLFSLDRSGAGQFFLSNGTNYFRARSGVGQVVITATRQASASSAITIATVTSSLAKATSTIVWGGIYSNTNSFTVSNPATTNLVLTARSSSGARVSFASVNTNVAAFSNALAGALELRAAGTSTITATAVGEDSFNYLPGSSNVTLIVDWTNPPVPEFTSTNRRDGIQDRPYRYVLTASNSPLSFGATNLAPGLSFTSVPPSIVGTNTQPGFYEMTLIASNAGGVTNSGLLSLVSPAPAHSQTNPWSFPVQLGLSTDTNGSYAFSNLPAGVSVLTNGGGRILSNANTSNGFAGRVTNLQVVYQTASRTNTNLFTLDVRPGLPVPIYASLSATQGIPLSHAPTSFRGTNVPGYPITITAASLPLGLTINATSGVIMGTSAEAGVFRPLLSARNITGNTNTNLLITLAPVAQAGQPLRLSLAGLFTNAPGTGTYSMPNLPPGMVLYPKTGVLEGRPAAVGRVQLQVIFTPDSGLANTGNYVLTIAPPVPQVRVPVSTANLRVGNWFYFQPWVTGPGWEWSGTDALTNSVVGSQWTNQLVIGGAPVNLRSNAAGYLLATTQGLTLVATQTGLNQLAVVWRSNLPVASSWQSMVRANVSTNLSLASTNQKVYPFLSSFLFPTNTNQYAAATALTRGGEFPASGEYIDVATNPPAGITYEIDPPLTRAQGREVWLRLTYAADSETLSFAVNTNATNPGTGQFTSLGSTTNPALTTAGWSFPNSIQSLRLAVGTGWSNVTVASNLATLSRFSLQPLGVGFSAEGLPSGLQIDPTNGAIFGTPTVPGLYTVNVIATNAAGAGQTLIRFNVQP